MLCMSVKLPITNSRIVRTKNLLNHRDVAPFSELDYQPLEMSPPPLPNGKEQRPDSREWGKSILTFFKFVREHSQSKKRRLCVVF